MQIQLVYKFFQANGSNIYFSHLLYFIFFGYNLIFLARKNCARRDFKEGFFLFLKYGGSIAIVVTLRPVERKYTTKFIYHRIESQYCCTKSVSSSFSSSGFPLKPLWKKGKNTHNMLKKKRVLLGDDDDDMVKTKKTQLLAKHSWPQYCSKA